MALIGPSGAGQIDADPLHQQTGRTHLVATSIWVKLELTGLSSGALRRERRRMGMIFPGVRLGRTTDSDGKRPVRTAWLCRVLAQLPAQIPAVRCGRGVSPCLIVSTLPTWPTSAPTNCPAGNAKGSASAARLSRIPQLLLVDEPTASLDPKTSRQIMRLICELCKERGLAAIINIHDVAAGPDVRATGGRPALSCHRIRRSPGCSDPRCADHDLWRRRLGSDHRESR